jgi:hypothetical protein
MQIMHSRFILQNKTEKKIKFLTMAFTRFHDDAGRVMKHLQESTDQGLYHLNTPGNGTQMAFVADPHVRLQKWGANRHANFVLLESELFGINTRLTCDLALNKVSSFPQEYPTNSAEMTAVPRSTEPAWEVRSQPQPRWETLDMDPQEHALVPFRYNTETRLAGRG